jgi:hypothetical protein
MKHPDKGDFDTAVTEAGVTVTFKPTHSIYTFYRLTDTNDIARRSVLRKTWDRRFVSSKPSAPRVALEVSNAGSSQTSERVTFSGWPLGEGGSGSGIPLRLKPQHVSSFSSAATARTLVTH